MMLLTFCLNYFRCKMLEFKIELQAKIKIKSGGFPCGLAGKECACGVGDMGLIPGLGRSPGEENSYPLQYSGLENSMDCIVHGVTKTWT